MAFSIAFIMVIGLFLLTFFNIEFLKIVRVYYYVLYGKVKSVCIDPYVSYY